MARKVLELTISPKKQVDDEGNVTFVSDRDTGKTFRLTEMPASQAEEWGIKAFLALGISGFDVPADKASMGMAGVAIVIQGMGSSIFQRIPYELLKPLLDEMMTCVQSVQPNAVGGARLLIETDIEEISTRMILRKQVVALHFDFFPSAEAQTSGQLSAEKSSSIG